MKNWITCLLPGLLLLQFNLLAEVNTKPNIQPMQNTPKAELPNKMVVYGENFEGRNMQDDGYPHFNLKQFTGNPSQPAMLENFRFHVVEEISKNLRAFLEQCGKDRGFIVEEDFIKNEIEKYSNFLSKLPNVKTIDTNYKYFTIRANFTKACGKVTLNYLVKMNQEIKSNDDEMNKKITELESKIAKFDIRIKELDEDLSPKNTKKSDSPSDVDGLSSLKIGQFDLLSVASLVLSLLAILFAFIGKRKKV